MSVSTSAQSVPLIYPNELEHLNDPPNGIVGNSVVLCLGNYPIRGKTTPIYQAIDLYGIKTQKKRRVSSLCSTKWRTTTIYSK